MKRRIIFDAKTIAFGLVASALTFVVLGTWRRVDIATFLFIQILALTLLLYIVLILASKRRFPLINTRELSIVMIVFLVVTSTTLNIDRSRSFATLKWVSEMQELGPVSVEKIITVKKLNEEDERAIEQRIKEQLQLGSLSKTSEGIKLSVMGVVIVWIAERISTLCNLTGYREL